MKQGNLANGIDQKIVVKQGDDEDVMITTMDTEESIEYSKQRYGFKHFTDDDGNDRIGIYLSDEELDQRMTDLRDFYKEGKIPWVCPSCGKLFGASYDVGSLQWFQCHVCGAHWELVNGEEVDNIIKEFDKPQLKLIK